jgi:peroxiredoxin 5
MNSPLIHNYMILIVSFAVVLFVSSSSITTTANAFTTTPSSTRSTQNSGRVTSSFLHMSSSSSDTAAAAAATNEIKVGDVVPPDIVLMELTESSVDGKPVTINLSELCQDKKVLIFGVPGAFTPGCSKSHLPSFMTAYKELTTNHQIDLILCVATNDAYTMEAWGRMSGGTETGIRFVSDHTGALTKYWGLQMENPVGIRTKRFTAILDQNVVTHYFTSTPESSNTWAPSVLAAL